MNQIHNFKWELDSEFSFNRSRWNGPIDFPLHLHDGFELYYLISGNVNYNVEGSLYEIKSGDMLIIYGQELHRPIVKPDMPYERITIHFSREYLLGFDSFSYNLLKCFIDRQPGRSNLVSASKIKRAGIDTLLKTLEAVEGSNSSTKEIQQKIALIQLLLSVNSIYEENIEFTDCSNPKISQVILYINENLGSSLSLEELAIKFFINKHHLCHSFKKATGLTLTEYINHKRIHKARALMSKGISATEAAQMCGFNDYSNFYRVFKKLSGTSPSTALSISIAWD